MNSSFFIARRYLFSKKSHNVINIISGVSVLGIMISTAALVIVLSAFNGIEHLVTSMFSSFEPDIKIQSANSKTFDQTFIPDDVYQVEGLTNYSRTIEEITIIKNEEMFIIGTIKGVENSFLEMSEMEDHLLDGVNQLEGDDQPFGLVGVMALQNLGAIIQPRDYPPEMFTIYSPNREERISRTNIDAFTTSRLPIVGTFQFNNDVDETMLVVPLSFAEEILDYNNEITALELDFKEGTNLESKKSELEEMLGPSFTVRTSFQKNEVIYQTSKTEKWITTLLLAFIFFLATFNMVASITMLVIEKKENMQTLYSLGARKVQLQRIFFYEGLLINGLGLVLGLTVGYLVCLAQMQIGIIKLQNSVVEYFPIQFRIEDLVVILCITVCIGLLAAYLPSKFLIKRIIK